MDFAYSGNKLHPTQKPISALAPLIESFCPPRGVLLDPFAGSGSSCIAARSVGRSFVGVEIDPVYHQAACQRMQGYVRRLSVVADNAHFALAA